MSTTGASKWASLPAGVFTGWADLIHLLKIPTIRSGEQKQARAAAAAQASGVGAIWQTAFLPALKQMSTLTGLLLLLLLVEEEEEEEGISASILVNLGCCCWIYG